MEKYEVRDSSGKLVATIEPERSSPTDYSPPDPRPTWLVEIGIYCCIAWALYWFIMGPLQTVRLCTWLFDDAYTRTFIDKSNQTLIYIPPLNYAMLLWAWYKSGFHLFLSFLGVAGVAFGGPVSLNYLSLLLYRTPRTR